MGLFLIERLFRYICKRIIIITANIMKDNYCVIMEAESVAVSGLSVEKVTQSNSLIFLGADGLYCK